MFLVWSVKTEASVMKIFIMLCVVDMSHSCTGCVIFPNGFCDMFFYSFSWGCSLETGDRIQILCKLATCTLVTDSDSFMVWRRHDEGLIKEVGEGASMLTTLSRLIEWELSLTQNFGIIMHLNGSRECFLSHSSSTVLTTQRTQEEKRCTLLSLYNSGVLLTLLSKAT